MKKILIVVFLLTTIKTIAQVPLPPVYLDPAGAAALGVESASAIKLNTSRNSTNKKWVSTAIGTTAETTAKTSLGSPKKHVHFIKYVNMCDSYNNKKKRKLCEEKVAYLRRSHTIVFDLLHVNTLHELRKGVRDLIWEKYASISNIIIKELELIKREADKEDKKFRFKYKG